MILRSLFKLNFLTLLRIERGLFMTVVKKGEGGKDELGIRPSILLQCGKRERGTDTPLQSISATIFLKIHFKVSLLSSIVQPHQEGVFDSLPSQQHNAGQNMACKPASQFCRKMAHSIPCFPVSSHALSVLLFSAGVGYWAMMRGRKIRTNWNITLRRKGGGRSYYCMESALNV